MHTSVLAMLSPKLRLYGGACFLAAVTFYIVADHAFREPYRVLRAEDVVVQVSASSAVIVLWLRLVPAIMLRICTPGFGRIGSLAIGAVASVSIFYLVAAQGNYIADITNKFSAR